MTLLLVMEALDRGEVTLDTMVTGSEYACSMGGTQVWLEPGEQLTLDEMLKAIAVGSANDCAVAVAEHLAGTEAAFVERMNQRAAELGCTGTTFINANGLDGIGEKDPDHRARSGADLMRAAPAPQDPGLHRYLDGQHPRRHIFARQHQQDAQKLSGPDRAQDRLYRRGGLLHLRQRRAGGPEPGRSGHGCPDQGDTAWQTRRRCSTMGLQICTAYTPPEDILAPVPVKLGRAESVHAGDGRAARVRSGGEGAGRGDSKPIWSCRHPLTAPVQAGQEIGTLTVTSGGETLLQVPLTAAEDVEAVTIPDLFLSLLGSLSG